MKGKTETPPAVREFLAAIGRKGGLANRGKASTKCRNAARAYWGRMTPAERSAEIRRRAKTRAANRAAKDASENTPGPAAD